MTLLDEVVVKSSPKTESKPFFYWDGGFGWITIWGNQRSGDTSGWKGTTTHSLESTDFITPQGSRSLANKTTGVWEWILSLFKNSVDSTSATITVEEQVTRNENTSTMEITNVAPVINQSVDVVNFTFNLSDSTITKNTNTVNFRGQAADVKRKVDSTNNRNSVKKNDKEAWLKSWGK